MPRLATSRPPGEHLAILARMLRQFDADDRMPDARRQRVKTLVSKIMVELQRELQKPRRVTKKRTRPKRTN